MSTPNYDPAKLASIKTYMTIAFIFNILGVIGFAIGGLIQVVTWATLSSYFFYAPGYATGLIIYGIVLLVFAVIAIIVLMRTYKMYGAANKGDIATLKQYNNMMWAILALIFAGVLPGIMLLIAFGPINELGQSPMGAPQGAYAPPPPPPAY
jgi:putative membrane protein